MYTVNVGELYIPYFLINKMIYLLYFIIIYYHLNSNLVVLSFRLLTNKKSVMMMNESVDIFDLVHEYLTTKGLDYYLIIS